MHGGKIQVQTKIVKFSMGMSSNELLSQIAIREDLRGTYHVDGTYAFECVLTHGNTTFPPAKNLA